MDVDICKYIIDIYRYYIVIYCQGGDLGLSDDKNAKRMLLYLTDDLKKRVEKMSEETRLSQNQLAVMALHSLVANYEQKGSFIFADLLNPENKK